jgi:hypothetical protein
MNDPNVHAHREPPAIEHTRHGPRRRPIHHSPFFWLSAFFILLAMIIYIVSGDLSFGPGRKAGPAVPALAP